MTVGQAPRGVSGPSLLAVEAEITPAVVRSALRKAEALGIIKVDWSEPDKPIATVLDHAALERIKNPGLNRRSRRAQRARG